MNLSPNIFYCDVCHYKCSKSSDYDKHLSTAKHKNRTILNNLSPKKFICKYCNKNYNARNSLWYHEQKCNYNVSNFNDDKELIMTLLKQNAEMLEIIKNGTNSHNTNSYNTNSNNKTFNLQVFLNETCKDAMNISEFIENISLQLSDLENMGKLGYVDGVSKIIIKNLNALDISQRPMHCTDKKRETVYVKDDDEWQKEENDKKRIKQVISGVVSKNLQLLAEYEDKYPECMNPVSKKSDEYNKIIMETIGGGTDVAERNKEKVIRKIAKEITIDKQE
jgi:hypothetical protein